MAYLTYNDMSQLTRKMYAQMTGREPIGNVPFGDFQNVFLTALANNDDSLFNVIPTVLCDTVVSMRPYSRKLSGMVWSEQKFGDYVRKITPILTADDTDFENKEYQIGKELDKTSGQDFSGITKPIREKVLLTFVSNGQTFDRKVTFYRNQLNAAFQSQGELERYFSAKLTEISNIYEQDLENVARAQIANVSIVLDDAGKESPTTGNPCRTEQCFHAISEYATETGYAMSENNIYDPQNFRPFMIWLAAKLDTLRDNLSNRTTFYHANFTGLDVNRHTPVNKMRMYLLSSFANYFDRNTAEIFNPDKLGLGDYEKVAFWQSLENPSQIKGSAVCPNKAGDTLITLNNKTVDNVIGLITDVDMFGICPVDQHASPEPYNAVWDYRNTHNKYTFKTPVDFTENAILIKLD